MHLVDEYKSQSICSNDTFSECSWTKTGNVESNHPFTNVTLLLVFGSSGTSNVPFSNPLRQSSWSPSKLSKPYTVWSHKDDIWLMVVPEYTPNYKINPSAILFFIAYERMSKVILNAGTLFICFRIYRALDKPHS